MAPKFRGRTDDWLDDQKSGRAVNRKNKLSAQTKKPKARGTALDESLANATVSEVYPKLCQVWLDHAVELSTRTTEASTALFQKKILCGYRRAEVIGATEIRERAPVAVGDRVRVENISSTDGVVSGICERRNRLARPAPAREGTVIQVLVANIDLLVIVTSVKNPEFSIGIVDRFLIAAQAQEIPAIICVNKIDLQTESQSPWSIYSKIGVLVYELSGKQGLGINELRDHLRGKRVAFCGHSGVGKTSLLSALMGANIGRVGTVSEFTGKGKHTTSSAVLLGGPDGSEWIDTPGVREFGLLDITTQTLRNYYSEFDNLPCATHGCLHFDHLEFHRDENCTAHLLPRHMSYLRIFNSLLEEENERGLK